MFGTRQNFHHSKLPKLGEVVELPSGKVGIVIAYPLCDNVLPYSVGIHTCYVQRLDNGKVIRMAGHWLVDQGERMRIGLSGTLRNRLKEWGLKNPKRAGQ